MILQRRYTGFTLHIHMWAKAHCLNMTQFVSARAEDETVLRAGEKECLSATHSGIQGDNATWCTWAAGG